MKQEFPTERKFHFNLRKPKGQQATPIYFVVFIGGKQYKLSTNVKVNPRHWDNTRQLAIVSNANTRLDNKNNRIVNERLSQVKAYYSEFIDYLCSQEETPANVVEVLKGYIYKDMAKKKTLTIDVIKTIRNAFSHYYKVISKIGDSTRIQYEKNLKRFISYIEEKKLNNNVDVFRQTGLNAYKTYLIEVMEKEQEIGNKRINILCELIERLINNVLVVNDEYQQYKFTTVKYVRREDKRQQDEIKRFRLYNDEIQAIKDCNTLSEKEQEYRTIFLLQCASGQRISDILQIINGNYSEKDGIITLQTIKKGIYSQIYITEEISKYLEELKEIKTINIDKFNDSTYNKNLKNICQKAGLNREYKWKDSREKSHINPIWEIMVSHNARHTFVTNKVKEGVPYDTLCLMTGHTDDKMIREVYANLTKEDKADKVRDYNKSKIVETGKPVKENKKQVNLYDELFAIPELSLLKDMQENEINIFDQPEINIIKKKLRDVKLLPKAIEELKDECPDIEENLSKLIWKICRAEYDSKTYNIFQYKCLKLGISKEKPTPEDILDNIWEAELKDLEENWQLYEYLEKENNK